MSICSIIMVTYIILESYIYIIVLIAKIIVLHINITMSHVDISKSYVNKIILHNGKTYLAFRGQKHVTMTLIPLFIMLLVIFSKAGTLKSKDMLSLLI